MRQLVRGLGLWCGMTFAILVLVVGLLIAASARHEVGFAAIGTFIVGLVGFAAGLATLVTTAHEAGA